MLSAGYAVHPRLFETADLDEFAAALASISLTRTRAGARHLMEHSCVARLASDARLIGLARPWLRGAAIPFRATLFDKSPDANWLVAWHQDTALPVETRRDLRGWGPYSEKAGVLCAHAPASALQNVIALRVHLNDSNDDNGPLRVLPGTHESGVLRDDQVQDCARRIGAVTCRADRGGVVVMRPLIVHASSKIAIPLPRRVLHIEYASSLDMGDGMRLRVA